jgi:hypothetical protein
MLPLPLLDDESFEEIFNDAKRQIPGLTTEWTDFNYHDPGITILQLFAWLKEMQQFYIDGIGDIHRLKYLKLLNYMPGKAERARVDITLQGAVRDTVIPKGTRFDAQGVIFETERQFSLLDNSIVCLQFMQGGLWTDISHLLEDSLSEYVFGDKPAIGNELLVGFRNPLPLNTALLLHVRMQEKKEIPRNETGPEGMYPLAELRWQYWTDGRWSDINELRDETCSLIKDGYIEFSIPACMEASAQGMRRESLCWIKCSLIHCCYDIAPRVENISIHSIRAVQQNTGSEILYFDGTGTDMQSYCMDTFLSLTGSHEVQVLVDGGLWEKWNDFVIEKGENWWQRKLTLLPGEDKKLPTAATRNIRVICTSGEMGERAVVAGSNGYPGQKYDIGLENVLEESFELQTGIFCEGRMLWRDWVKTDDLLLEDSESFCYELDARNGVVLFGDGENGAIPCKGTDNIRIISCAQSNGLKGNIKDGGVNTILAAGHEIEKELSGITAVNQRFAEGGKDSESIDEALLRFRKDFGKAARAITGADFENIVKETPGLMICKARSIPGYRPDRYGLAQDNAGNCITVAVKAFSDQTDQPGLNEAYRQNIESHLDKYRLVTTEVHIVPPRYIGIRVTCMIEVKPYFKDIKGQMQDFFRRELDGVQGKRDFGQSIEYGDIYGKMESLDCVKRVISLSLEPHGAGAVKKYGGDIHIPPDGLTYMEMFELSLKE